MTAGLALEGRPASAERRVRLEHIRVGDPFKLRIILRNDAAREASVLGLRSHFARALPEEIELLGTDAQDSLRLAPGESRTLTFELAAFDIQVEPKTGFLWIDGMSVPVQWAEPAAAGRAPALRRGFLDIPKWGFEIRSVIGPDWKNTPFDGIHELQVQARPDALWLASLPLLLSLLAAAELLRRSKKSAAPAAAPGPSLLEGMRERIARLELLSGDASLPAAVFYAEFYAVLSGFAADVMRLPAAERDHVELLRDLKRQNKLHAERNGPAGKSERLDDPGPARARVLDSGQLSVIELLSRKAESMRHDPASRGKDGPDSRRRDLNFLRGLAESVTPQAAERPGGSGSMAGFGGLEYAGPWPALLAVFVLTAAYLLWHQWRSWREPADRTPSITHAAASELPARKTWRVRLAWLPAALEFSRVALTVLMLLQPHKVAFEEVPVASNDMVIAVDASRSMGEPFEDSGITKLDAARDAGEAVIELERRGALNRIGLILFSEHARVEAALSTAYDALVRHVRDAQVVGDTAIGEAILASASMFLEANIKALPAEGDVRVRDMQRLLAEKGPLEALRFAQGWPDLLRGVVRPDIRKTVFLVTDGDNKSGISPRKAASIVQRLNEELRFDLRVYPVPVLSAERDGNGDDEEAAGREKKERERALKALSDVAQLTGGRSIPVRDAQGLRRALLEVHGQGKTHVTVSLPTFSGYDAQLASLGLILLLLQTGLSVTWLRRFPMILLVAALPLSGLMAPGAGEASPGRPVHAARALDFRSGGMGELLMPGSVPKELADANEAYARGRLDEAIKAYARALEAHPDLPEIYFNMGSAYFQLGGLEPANLERAAASYAKYLALVQGDRIAGSKALFNLGEVARLRGDADNARLRYRQALKADAGNERARKNLELLERRLKEQDPSQGDGESRQKRKRDEPKPGKQGDDPGQRARDSKQGPDENAKGGGSGDDSEEDGSGSGDEKKDALKDLLEQKGAADGRERQKRLKDIQREGDHFWGIAALPSALAAGAAALGLPGAAEAWELSVPLQLSAAGALFWPIVGIGMAVLAGLLAYGVYRGAMARRAWQAAQQRPDGIGDPGFDPRRRVFLQSAMLLGQGALLGAVAGAPRPVGRAEGKLNLGGADVFVLVDASYSGLFAKDGRKESIRRDTAAFLRRMDGRDRFGLGIFAGNAAILAHLTALDQSIFLDKLGRLEELALDLSKGSDALGAIQEIAAAFERSKKVGDRPPVVLMISDGNFFPSASRSTVEKDLEQAIFLARERGITIYAIGVGAPREEQPDGVEMEVPTADGKGSQCLVDKSASDKAGKSQCAKTFLDEGPLRRLARATNGEYFRSGRDGTIGGILERIARMRGRGGELAVPSPRSASPWFLWPLLALQLAAIMLNRELRAARSRSREESGRLPVEIAAKPGFLPLLGLAFLPVSLSAWPVVLAFALFAVLVSAAVLLQVFNGGALIRRLRWAYQGRLRTLENGLASQGDLLFDFGGRETDRLALREFLASWSPDSGRSPIPEDAKRALILEAAADESLGRQKLLAAYLQPNSGAVRDALFAALFERNQDPLSPLGPVVAQLLARRTSLAWLDHPDPMRRIARLAQLGLDPANARHRALLSDLALYPDEEVRGIIRQALHGMGTARPEPPASRAWGWRIAAGALGLLLAWSLSLAAWGAWGTRQYLDRRAEAGREATAIFYGRDAQALEDRYYRTDERIPKEVLPVLRRWSRSSGPGGAAEMERALRVLRESLDPRADVLLEAVYQRIDLFPIPPDSAAEGILFRALLERETQQALRFLEAQAGKETRHPSAIQRAKRWIDLAGELGTDQTFLKLFLFLGNPNAELRTHAAEAIYASLVKTGREELFLGRLTHAFKRYEGDPASNMWILSFMLEPFVREEKRVLEVLLRGTEEVKVEMAVLKGLWKDVLWAGERRIREERRKILAGAEGKPPPSFTERGLDVLAGAIDRSTRGGTRPVPELLAEFARNRMYFAMTELLSNGEAVFTGENLDKRLREAGIKPAPAGPEDAAGPEGLGGGGGGRGPYRRVYALEHFRALRRVIDETAASMSGREGGLDGLRREYAERADAVLKRLEAAGKAAGVPDGDSPGDRLAQALNPVLEKGVQALPSGFYLQRLRQAGLASRVDDDPESRFHQAYDPPRLRRVRLLLEGMLSADTVVDVLNQPRTLFPGERRYLFSALEEADRLLAVHYPDAVRDVPPTIGRLLTATQARDPEVRAWGEGELARALAAAELEGSLGPRLLAAAERHAAEPELQLWVIRHILGRYADSSFRGLPGVESLDLLEFAVGNLAERGRLDSLSPLLGELEKTGDARPRDLLRHAVLKHIHEGTKSAAREAMSLFRTLLDRWTDQGFITDRGYAQPVFTVRLLDALHRDILEEFERVRTGVPADEEQAGIRVKRQALAERVGQMFPVFIRVGAQAGLMPGGTPGEAVAAKVNPLLKAGYGIFKGFHFIEALRDAGLGPKVPDYQDLGYFQSYSREDASRILRFIQDIASRGRGWDQDGKPRPLNDEERSYLEDAERSMRGWLEEWSSFDGGAPSAASVTSVTWSPHPWVVAAAALAVPLWPGAAAALEWGSAASIVSPLVPALWAIAGFLTLMAAVRFFARRLASAAGGPSAEPGSDVRERARWLRLEAGRFAASRVWGMFRSRMIGLGGGDFAEFSPYRGEPIRFISWRAWAKTGKPHVRRDEQERELPLMLLVDLSASVSRKTVEAAAALLAFAAEHDKMPVGAVLFTDRVELVIEPGRGPEHIGTLVSRILEFRPASGHGSDPGPALDFLGGMPARSMSVLISDLLFPPSRYAGSLSEIARDGVHDLIAVRARAPQDLRPLPTVGLVRVRDAESGDIRWIDTDRRGLAGEHEAGILSRELAITSAFEKAGIDLVTISSEGEAAASLVEQLDLRRAEPEP